MGGRTIPGLSARLPGSMRRIGLTVILALSLLVAPLAAEGQDATKKRPLVGFLCNTAKLAPAFGDGLRELGYVDGKNIFLEYRCAEGRTERGPQLAAALLKLKPDVLVAASDPFVKVFLPSGTTSLPIPSPGIAAIRCFMRAPPSASS